MTDQFGNKLEIGDWVYFASTYGGSTTIRKGQIYDIVEDPTWTLNNKLRLVTYKKTHTNSIRPCNPAEEMAKKTVKLSVGPWNCVKAKD